MNKLMTTNTDNDIINSDDPLAASPSKSRRNLSRLIRSGGALATAKNRQRTNCWIWLFVGLAFFVSITNFIIGQHSANNVYYHYHHKHELTHEQSPVERLARISTSDIQHLRGGDDSIDATTKNSNDDYQEEVYTGEDITQILKGNKPFPSKNNNKNIMRLRYKPGTLKLSHADTLQHCYVNTTIYAGHITDRPQSLVSLSDKYKLIYRNIPKSSSSSARHAMADFLEGDDNRMKHDTMEELVHERGYSMVSFIREPMNRFYSSYDEAFFRMGPWMGDGPIVRDKPRVRKAYFENKYRIDKYPYLYEGFDDIQDFRRLYCPEETLATGRFLDCNLIPSIDDGNLAHRFEQFVRDYNGLDPFDIHLNLQLSNLIFPTGEPFPVTTLYNSSIAEKGWQEIANSNGVTIPDGEMTHGRKITRRFNVSNVSKATKRKICSILAIDYCCLNMQLPEECREDDEDDEDAVYCAIERRNEKAMKYALQPFVIQPWRHP